MKKRNFKTLFVLLTLCALILPVFASCSALNLSEECAQWSAEETADGKITLTDGEKTYEYVKGAGLRTNYEEVYEYFNSVSLPLEGFDYSTVYGPDSDSEYVWVYNGYNSAIFATEKGKEEISAFKNGKVSAYRLTNEDDDVSVMDDEVVSRIKNAYTSADLIEKDITDLGHRTRYDIEALDESKGLRYVCGSVYLINGVWYYLDHGDLGEEFFNEDGILIYRDGVVSVVALSADLGEKILGYEDDLDYYERNILYESSDVSERLSEENSESVVYVLIVIMVITYLLFGLILPALIFAFGMILPHIKMLGKPKYWYIISVLAALWFLLSILFALVLFIAFIVAVL